MKLESIITMANEPVRLQFLALERSLRATGCTLPLKVIPYDQRKFALPDNSTWWELPEMEAWLTEKKAHRLTRKYQCMTTANYQFVDADVVFLRDPSAVLAEHESFVASCTEWNKLQFSFKPETATVLSRFTSTWHQNLFSVGQFACDRSIATLEQLKTWVEGKPFEHVCLRNYSSDQVGTNLLVAQSRVPFNNLTLPPVQMQSTWAGDYPGEFQSLWSDPATKPYLIHWAGPTLQQDLPINDLFYQFLTRSEILEWKAQQAERQQAALKRGQWPWGVRLLNRAVRLLDKRFWVQWKPLDV
jgi:hypothetical protein